MKLIRRLCFRNIKLYLILIIILFFIFNLKLWFREKSFTISNTEQIILKLNINESLFKFRLKRYNLYNINESYRKGKGEYGKADIILENEIENIKKVMLKEGFNKISSNRISLERSLPDFRSKKCKSIQYQSLMSTISVIIIFTNEELSTILRTVYSVVNRTPPNLLYEVIIVDDNSNHDELGEKLENTIHINWPDNIIKLIRSTTRIGLIKARMLGANKAKGDILLFLDSHCEVSRGWSEPLVSEIVKSPSNVVMPVIEDIDSHSMKYYGSEYLGKTGSFWWSMHFTWQEVPQHFQPIDQTEPVKSSTMAGGIFAIDKNYFHQIGEYDKQMEIWGGENLEMSFRIWMCGGALLISPCSHVGHIFRSIHPYGFPGNKDYHGINTKRFVEVWLDDYKDIFYMYRPDLKFMKVNVSERKQLRQKLNCHSFQWFVDNIIKEKFVPFRNVLHYGYLSNPISNLCLDVLNQNEFDMGNLMMGVYECYSGTRYNSRQLFNFNLLSPNRLQHDQHLRQRNVPNKIGQIRRDFGCLTVSSNVNNVAFQTCSDALDYQLWIYYENIQLISSYYLIGQCLDVTELNNGDILQLRKCDPHNKFQQFIFQYNMTLDYFKY